MKPLFDCLKEKPYRTLIQCTALLVGGALLLYLCDIGCLVKAVCGIPCPGCGTTRAWLSLFAGRLPDAFFYHPLFWLTPPLFALGVINPAWLHDRKAAGIFWGILFLYFAVYFWRMFTLFPETPPMDVNADAILFRLADLIF